MARKQDETINVNLRLPPALHRQLVRAAARNNRSLNTEMVLRLGEPSAAAEMIATKMALARILGTLEALGHTIPPEHHEKVLAAVWGPLMGGRFAPKGEKK